MCEMREMEKTIHDEPKDGYENQTNEFLVNFEIVFSQKQCYSRKSSYTAEFIIEKQVITVRFS